MKRTHSTRLEISLKVEFFKVVKVKSYIRVRNGKIERVKGHEHRC